MTLRTVSLAFGMAYATMAQPGLNVPVSALAVGGDTPNAVYASPGTGLVRTTNDGLNWRAQFLRPAGERQPVIRTLLVDSSDPKVLYAATDLDDGGIWKSRDGGTTWTIANTGLPQGTGAITWMFQVPAAPSTLYTRVGSQLFKTSNGGESWAVRGNLPPNATAIAVYPADPTIMYAAQPFGVYRSSDEGASWGLAPDYNPIGLPQGTVFTSLLVDPTDSRNILAAAVGTGGNTGIFRSTNAAQAFTRVFASLPLELSGNPRTPGVVFATSIQRGVIYKSTNNGASWRPIVASTEAFLVTLAHHPRDPSVLWAGTDRGALVSTDAGERWASRSGTVVPTISAPSLPYSFRLTTGQQGRLDLGISVVETERWAVPIQVNTSGDNWLSVSGVTGTTPATVQVRVNAGNLEPGEYSGTVRILAPQAANDRIEVPVRLTVAPAPPLREYTISTLAGTGQIGRFGDGSQARFAAFSTPDSVAVDRDGNVLISDAGNHTLRRVTTNGIINRFAGVSDPGFSGDGGVAALAAMRGPRGIAFDPSNGWLYVADAGNLRVRRISPEGDIFAFFQGLENMRGVAVDKGGNVYVALPSQHVVARISRDGEVTRFAGTGLPGYRGDSVEARFTRLSGPTDVAVDSAGVVYIADTENHRIRAVDANGIIRTVAGNGASGFQGEGRATAGALSRPSGIAADDEGNLYVADTENHRIRLVTADGRIETIAGTGTAGFSGDGGPAGAATLRQPTDVAVDSHGNLFVVDSQNIRVRKLDAPIRPEISSVVNGGDYTPRLAPGGVFALFGANFGETGEVLIDGKRATVAFYAQNQINGVVPESAKSGPAQVQVVNAGVGSRLFPVVLAAAAPAWVVAGGRIVSINETGERNSPDFPALPGTELTLYATGVGIGGETPRVLAGESEWELLEFSPAEGLPGIAKVRVRVPADGAPGDVALTLHVGEAASPEATVAVSSSPSGQSDGPG